MGPIFQLCQNAVAAAPQLWRVAVRPHVPCVVRGAFQGIVDLCEPLAFAARFGDHAVPVRRR